ncbi:Zinc finger C2H2-type [Cinara cedri]|uniref:Zinc finger C2H2-type n=1 Tax=Cinara cedri TaxID=506608 RepID=A0A5E4M3E8_9HEMI|nr:Zinc finger C2H2-type [Cinara cedri]
MRLSNGNEGTTDSMVEMFNEHFLDEDGTKFILNPAELDDLLGRDQYAADCSPIVVSAQQQHHHHGHHHHHHQQQQQQPNSVADQPNTKPTANFADLKPLMPFHTITERVNINGIPGHHYQSIASNNRVAENNNNNSATANNNNNNNNMYFHNEYLVTSSTNTAGLICKFKEEDTFVDNQFDEFEMLMGSPSFGPDTTVSASGEHHPTVVDGGPEEWLGVGDEWPSYEHPNGSPEDNKTGILADVTIQDLVASSQFPGISNGGGGGGGGTGGGNGGGNAGGGSYHQQPPPMQKPSMYQQPQPRELVTSNVPPPAPRPAAAAFMPLLANRLQNGPANKAPLQDAGSYHMDCASSPSSSTPSYLAHSPTSHVVSTTDLGGYNMPSVHSSRPSPPEFAHTTTPGQGPHMTTKKSRNRSGKAKGGGGGGGGGAGGVGGATARNTVVYCSDGNVARERTVHNCHICNRGFLNKSNIKVHLRTHTGEKPFRCEVCQKAFRQKAHLIKHAQIHKRSGRD